MRKKVVQQKEKVKVDKNALGITFQARWDAMVLGDDGLYYDLKNKKRYKEININTTNDLPDNNKTRY
jgi:hypothetical protein